MSRAEPLAMVAGSPSHCIGHMTCSGKDTQGSIGKGTQRSPSGIRSPGRRQRDEAGPPAPRPEVRHERRRRPKPRFFVPSRPHFHLVAAYRCDTTALL